MKREVRYQISEVRYQEEEKGREISDIRGQISGRGEGKREVRGEKLKSTVQIKSAKELIVYQKAYKLAMLIFEVSHAFPVEERYALTSQIRRSSRSVCLNLREAWAKRRYEAHFISKLTDCDGENSETDTSLDFALSCGYISVEKHSELVCLVNEVGRMLGSMINNPEGFLLRKTLPSDL